MSGKLDKRKDECCYNCIHFAVRETKRDVEEVDFASYEEAVDADNLIDWSSDIDTNPKYDKIYSKK